MFCLRQFMAELYTGSDSITHLIGKISRNTCNSNSEWFGNGSYTFADYWPLSCQLILLHAGRVIDICVLIAIGFEYNDYSQGVPIILTSFPWMCYILLQYGLQMNDLHTASSEISYVTIHVRINLVVLLLSEICSSIIVNQAISVLTECCMITTPQRTMRLFASICTSTRHDVGHRVCYTARELAARITQCSGSTKSPAASILVGRPPWPVILSNGSALLCRIANLDQNAM